MRREQVVNSKSLSLNGTINSTVTSVVLSDASALPSNGDFRLSLDDEIVKVIARSGNTLTVERGVDNTSAASHTNGISPIVIATQCGLDKMLMDALGPDRMDLTTPQRLTVNSSDFTWVNQGTSTVSDDTWGGITLAAALSSSHSLHCLVKSVPSTPWVLTAHFKLSSLIPGGTGGCHSGLVIRESSSGKIESLSARNYEKISWFNWNSATSYNSTNASDEFEIAPKGVWLRFSDDGTNLETFSSHDGLNWYSYGSASRTHFLSGGADQLGFYFSNAEADGLMLHLTAWAET